MSSDPGRRGRERHIVALLGRPGSGKSSAAEALEEVPAVWLLQASDVLEEEATRDTRRGREVARRMERGELVETAVVAELLEERVGRAEAPLVVLDGFPRNSDQVDALDGIARRTDRTVSLIVVLVVPRATAEERLTGRRVCTECGRVYNVHTDPPPADACEECGGRLERRDDDRPEIVRERHDRFDRETRPVVRWFSAHRPERIECLRAGGTPDQVRRRLVEVVRERHPAAFADT